VKAGGIASLTTSGALAKLQAGVEDKDAAVREGALLAAAAVAEEVGRPAEPYLIPLLGSVLGALADKAAPVRAAATKAQAALEGLLNPHGIAAVLPTLFDAMLAQKWQTNEGACKMLSALTDRAPRQVAVCLPEIVPKVTEAMGNARPAVKDAAVEAMTKCMNVVGNRDIEVFIPILVNCLQNPTNVPDTVHKLAATTFVQTVEAPTLSIMVRAGMGGGWGTGDGLSPGGGRPGAQQQQAAAAACLPSSVRLTCTPPTPGRPQTRCPCWCAACARTTPPPSSARRP
jgi:elongation factor 3